MEKRYLIVLKIILLFSVLYITYYRINNKKYIENNKTSIIGIVRSVKDNKIVINNYQVICKDKTNINIGSTIKVNGRVKKPSSNTNFNLFNYKNYLLSKKIDYLFYADSIKIIKNSNSFKNKFINYVNSINNPILSTLILGDNRIDEDEYEKIKTNGISHLFAISGMHISFISLTLLLILNKISKRKKLNYLIVSSILIFYAYLTTMSASIIRSVLLFVLMVTKFKTIDLLFYLFLMFLIYNPFYIYDLGFLYSFVNSFFLLYFKPDSLLKTSIIAFLSTFLITVNSTNQVNILSPFLNLFYVPFITYIIFPLCFIVLLIPKLNFILNFFIGILNYSNKIFYKYKLIFIFKTLSPLLIIFYYILLILYLKRKLNYMFYLTFIVLYFRFNIYPVVNILDVGQGDSALIELPFFQGNIMIDTGGSQYSDINKYVITPFLKSRGIKKIDYLILTHGDYDHMGASHELIKSYNVGKIIINSYEDNELEKKLKNVYHFNKNTLKINNYTFYFLNTANRDENEDSLIIYTKLNNYKFLFMGDASVSNEEYLLNTYNLNNIDFLKVGHHGSNTSSSKKFIDAIKPNNSLISVGKNNFYGHPSKEILNNLKNSNIYRTDINGGIEIVLYNKKYQIKTCTS